MTVAGGKGWRGEGGAPRTGTNKNEWNCKVRDDDAASGEQTAWKRDRWERQREEERGKGASRCS